MQQLSSTIPLRDQTNATCNAATACLLIPSRHLSPAFFPRMIQSLVSSPPFLLSARHPSTYTHCFQLRKTKCLVAFPSVLTRREEQDLEERGARCPHNNSTVFSPQSREEEYCFDQPYSPKPHPFRTKYVLTHTHSVGRGADATSMWEYFHHLELLKLWGKLMKRGHND